MRLMQILSASLVVSLALNGSSALSQATAQAAARQAEPIIGWNLTESDLKNLRISDLLIKAGGKAALGKIQLAARPSGTLSSLLIKKSKQDNIAPLLMGIACKLELCDGNATETALYYFRASANLGNFRAMQELAELLPKSEAVPWLKKAAEAAYPGAMNKYGFALATGEGTNQDPASALNWFRKSAELGSPVGIFNVGMAYHNGFGQPMDKNEAMAWFQRAADTGYAPAIQVLGKIYIDGDGVAQDRSLGLLLLQRAAAAGSVEAKTQLAEIDRAEKEQQYAADLAAGQQRTAAATASGARKCSVEGWMGLTCLDRAVVQTGTTVWVSRNQSIIPTAAERSSIGTIRTNQSLLFCERRAGFGLGRLSLAYMNTGFDPFTGKPANVVWTNGEGNRGTCDASKGRFRKVPKV